MAKARGARVRMGNDSERTSGAGEDGEITVMGAVAAVKGRERLWGWTTRFH